MLVDFKDEDFDNKVKNEDVSVIQFSAAWCGPCKALKPVMDKLAEEYKDKAGFYYADIEDGGINTGSAAGIRGVPTVIIYKKGVEVDRKVGGVPESHMKEHLGNWLSQLNEREQKIMRLRFGLDGGEPLTLADIGRQISVSRERVRQLEAKAILKLRVMTTHQKAA